jgi:hypothetical protein
MAAGLTGDKQPAVVIAAGDPCVVECEIEVQLLSMYIGTA